MTSWAPLVCRSPDRPGSGRTAGGPVRRRTRASAGCRRRCTSTPRPRLRWLWRFAVTSRHLPLICRVPSATTVQLGDEPPVQSQSCTWAVRRVAGALAGEPRGDGSAARTAAARRAGEIAELVGLVADHPDAHLARGVAVVGDRAASAPSILAVILLPWKVRPRLCHRPRSRGATVPRCGVRSRPRRLRMRAFCVQASPIHRLGIRHASKKADLRRGVLPGSRRSQTAPPR